MKMFQYDSILTMPTSVSIFDLTLFELGWYLIVWAVYFFLLITGFYGDDDAAASNYEDETAFGDPASNMDFMNYPFQDDDQVCL